MPEKFSMRELIAAAIGPRSDFDTRESWLARAARAADISYRQAKALWYGEITDPDHKAARRMRDAAERAAKKEASHLAQQFKRIADGMNAQKDKGLYRDEDIAALINAARILSGLDRPGNRGGGA